MNRAYYIVDWADQYELTSDERTFKPGGKPKVGPLRFVKLPAPGHAMPVQDKQLQEAAESPEEYEAALCVWPKLLAVSAGEKRELRGWVLTERHQPATAAYLATLTGIRKETIERGLRLLAHPDVGLIELRLYPPDSAEDCKNLQDCAVAPTTEPKRTKQNITKLNETSFNSSSGRSSKTPKRPETDVEERDFKSLFASARNTGAMGQVFLIEADQLLKHHLPDRDSSQIKADHTSLSKLAAAFERLNPTSARNTYARCLSLLEECLTESGIDRPMGLWTGKIRKLPIFAKILEKTS